MNYKIKVNSESESREVQELFFELSGRFEVEPIGAMCLGNPYLYLDDRVINSGIGRTYLAYSESKEITLPELRDIVV